MFGVYPWSRLLGAGPEPLHVLDSCRIGWGRVVTRTLDGIEVAAPRLTWDGAALGLSDPTPLAVGTAQVQVQVEVGDAVALHWGRVCAVLDPAQVADLATATARELASTTRRLGRAVPAS